MRRIVSGLMVITLVTSVLALALNVQRSKGDHFRWTANADGDSARTSAPRSLDPPPMVWNQTYGGTDYDYAFSVVQTVDGGYAIAGPTRSFGAGNDDFWLVKTDAAGNMQWNQTYGGTDYDGALSVVQTVDGGYAIAGATYSFGAGGWDFWLIKLAPEATVHDVAVIGVVTSKTGCTPAETIGQGQTTEINATAENQGALIETFNVTVYADATPVGSQQVTLNPAETRVLTYTWDTTLYPYGNYSITAVADIVLGEIDVADNTYNYGWMFVTIPGDMDGDVDIFDIVRMSGVYGLSSPDPEYDSNCDIDGNGDVDIFDIVIAAGNYGESW